MAMADPSVKLAGMMRRTWIAWVCVLALLLLLAWSAPAWLCWLLRGELARAGWHDVQCEIASLGWHQARLRLVRGRPGAGLTIVARDLVLRYRWADVWRGRLASLHIGALELRRRHRAGVAQVGVPPLVSPALLRSLPVDVIEVASLRLHSFWGDWQGRASLRHEGLAMTLENRAHDVCQLEMQAQGAFDLHCAGPALHVAGKLQERGQQFELALEWTSDLAKLNSLLLHAGQMLDLAPTGGLVLQGRFSLPRDARSWDALRGQAHMAVQASLLDGALRARFDGTLALAARQLAWRLDDQARLHIDELQLHGSHLAGVVDWRGRAVELRLQPQAQWLVRGRPGRGLRRLRLRLMLPDGARIRLGETPTLLHDTVVRAALQAESHGVAVTIPDGRIDLSAGAWSEAHGVLRAREIRFARAGAVVHGRDVHLAFARRQGRWRGEGRMLFGDGVMPVHLAFAYGGQQGWLRLRTGMREIAAHGPRVQSVLRALRPGLTLRAGRWDLRLQFHVRDGHTHGEVRLQVQDLSGEDHGYIFTRAQGRLVFSYRDGSWRLAPATWSLARLQAGLDVRDLTLRVSMTRPAGGRSIWRIDALSARLLGGTLAAASSVVDFNRPRNELRLRVRGLDLARIVALERQQGLRVSGRMDGELPVQIGPAGVRLREGRLQARSPGGRIRYRPEGMADAARNPALSLALGALSDFRYDRLDVRADYWPDGRLVLRVHVHGRNPDFQQGRAVDLHVRIEENVHALLRSLGLAGDIEQQLRDRLRPMR